MNITGNRKTALFLAVVALVFALWSYYTVLEYATSPLLIVFVMAPLAAIIGIVAGNKAVLAASSLLSLIMTALGIMTVGFMFVPSSLVLIVSMFIYLKDSENVDEKRKSIATNAMYASMISAIAAVSFEGKWLIAKIISGNWILPDIDVVFLFLLPVALPVVGLRGIRSGNKDILAASAAISMVTGIFLGVLLLKPLFLVSSILIIFSAAIYGRKPYLVWNMINYY